MFYRTRPFFFLALHSPSPAPAHANKRVMLERWSPKSLAASAAVLEPSRTVRMISCCWCGLNLAGRPTLTRDLGPSPFTDHRPLEFSKTSQHLHHHAARRGCRIHRLSEAPKASACLAVRYVLVRMIVGSQIVHGRYNGSAQETESIPLTEYFPCSLDISGRQNLGKFENFLWSKFFAGLERPVRVMTWENGVIIRSGP